MSFCGLFTSRGVLLACFFEFLSIQKEAEEAENEQVVRKKKSHLIEDLKVGKTVFIGPRSTHVSN